MLLGIVAADSSPVLSLAKDEQPSSGYRLKPCEAEHLKSLAIFFSMVSRTSFLCARRPCGQANDAKKLTISAWVQSL